ncbi:interferon-induced protein with tetratricopeptide repeats 1 [Amia ocellicauda]|uniref:interferon-induced protein with tetratricopeptide repeats 1 n=1 Tax=Amia ocellicauda TaxID=2972642 RepID=UPI003463B454
MLIVPYGDFAWLYYKMGDHTNAQRYLEKLAQIADKFPRASPVILHPELYGEKAWSLLKFSSENYELAKTFFEMALKEQPENKEWHSGYAIVLTRLEGLGTRMSSEQDSIALPQLRLAKQLDPGNAFVTIYLGLKLTEYGYMQEAQELAEQALQKAKDNPQVIRNVVKLFRLHGSLDRAFALLERALQLSPDTCFLKHQLALCCKWKYGIEKQSNRDNREELNSLLSRAIENFNEVLRVQPNYIYIEFDLAEMYAESGDKEIAEEIFMEMFGRLSEMKPKDVQAFYLYYGNFKYYHRESPEEAIALYKEGIKISEPSWAREKCSLRLNKLQTR